MSAVVSREENPRKFQFPLWALLFLMPTLVANLCGGWVAIQSQLAFRQELREESAMLSAEYRELDSRVQTLRNLVERHERALVRWRSPRAVMEFLRDGHPDEPWRFRRSYVVVREYPSDMAYFFHQASDDDLRELAEMLIKVDPLLDPQGCVRRLECFSMFPEFVSDRSDIVADDVRRMATPLQEHSRPEIARAARRALQAFDLPVEEEHTVFLHHANGEPVKP